MAYSKIKDLKNIANKIRIDCIKMISNAKAGHPGSSLSSVDLLAILFFNQIKRTVSNALDPNRDRFVLSKGHAVPVLYSIFRHIGLIEEEELKSFRQIGSRLQGHPDVIKLPFLEASTGSLGQGLSIAQGMAIRNKIDNVKSSVYCLIGDGEIQQGQIWEAFMSASKMKLDNLCVILDYNKLQIDGAVQDVMPIEPIKSKLQSFNWNVTEINGHDYEEIIEAYESFKNNSSKPFFIIAHTIKGKGVPFMENDVNWHGKAPNEEETKLALEILENIKY